MNVNLYHKIVINVAKSKFIFIPQHFAAGEDDKTVFKRMQ